MKLGLVAITFFVLSASALAVCLVALALGARYGELIASSFRGRKRMRSRGSDGTGGAAQASPPIGGPLPGRLAEDASDHFVRLRRLYTDFYASDNWRRCLAELSSILPSVVEKQALTSRRSAADIVRDILQVLVYPLTVNLRSPAELRLEQAKPTFRVCWIAAYPFLDLVEESDGGFYETLRSKLASGCQYVFFQPDRRYFDLLKGKLVADPELGPRELLDEDGERCQLWCIHPASPFMTFVNFAIWNPGQPDMEGYINVGDPIELSQQGHKWRIVSRPLMKPIGPSEKLQHLYEEIARPVYDSFFRAKSVMPKEPGYHISGI